MKIRKGKKEGQYEVESSREKGKFYIIDIHKGSCSCPYWLFHLVKTGEKCKHILAVEKRFRIKIKERAPSKDREEAKPKKAGKSKTNKLAKALDYIRSKGEVSAVELIDKFGEEALNSLIEQGEVIEQKGRIMILS